MATLGIVTAVIAEVIGLSPQRVYQVAKLLRLADQITTGARGRNAPNIPPNEVARILLALIGSDRNCDAVKTVLLLQDIVTGDGRSTLGVLTDLLEKRDDDRPGVFKITTGSLLQTDRTLDHRFIRDISRRLWLDSEDNLPIFDPPKPRFFGWRSGRLRC